MTAQAYEFVFETGIALDEVRDTLKLATLACSAIHGEADVLVDAGREIDTAARTLRFDCAAPAGRDLMRLFARFAQGEFGSGAFTVRRLSAPASV